MSTRVCIKCLKIADHNQAYQILTPHAFQRMQQFAVSWADIHMHTELNRITSMTYSEDLLVHKDCYATLTHKNNLEKARRRFSRSRSSAKSIDKVETSSPETYRVQANESRYPFGLYDSEIVKLVQEKVIVEKKTVDMQELESAFNDLLSEKGIHHDYNFNYISRHFKKVFRWFSWIEQP